MTALVKSALAQALPDGEWDPYRILGIARRASTKTIRAAYRKLAKKVHSDVTGDAAAFLLLKEAHDFLLDPAARSLWDRKKIRATEQFRTIAIMHLTAMFDAVVSQVAEGSLPPEHQDIPALVKKVIRGNLDDLAKAESAHRRKLSRLRLMEGRVRRRSGGENVVTIVLEKRISETDTVLAKIADEVRLGDIMLAELESYEGDVIAAPEAFGGSSSAFGSAFSIRIF